MLHLLFAFALGSPMLVAGDSRCNDVEINGIEARLRKLDGNLRAGSPADRGASLLAIQSDIGQEQVILGSICAEHDYRADDARLAALDAWADILIYANGVGDPACRDEQKKIESGAVATAWVKLAEAATVAGDPPKVVAMLEPRVRALAADAALTLPAYADATSYWAAPLQQASRDAIAACSAPAPSASP
jgi:hypothetical protein